MLRGLIIEGSEMANSILGHLCEKFNGVEILGNYSNGFNAIKNIHTAKLDFVLLDIETPNSNGIDFEKCARDLPSIIFTTSRPNCASNAMQLRSIDSISEPLSIQHLLGAFKNMNSNDKKESISINFKNQELQKEISALKQNEGIVLNVDGHKNLELNIGEEKVKVSFPSSTVHREEKEQNFKWLAWKNADETW